MKKIEISVIVLTYFPKWTELKKTLLSIIHQEGINYEILIADDGSDNYCIEEITDFFKEYNYDNYEVVHQEKNVGTCKNCLAAIKVAKGEYVRLISPGDYISTSNSLRDWYEFMQSNNADASFGNAIYYNMQDGKYNIITKKGTAPIVTNIYDAKKYKSQWVGIFNLVLYDSILGAAFLTKRDLMQRYCEEVVEANIIYTEDKMYKFMIMDEMKILHYPLDVVIYEYGEGISTSSNEASIRRMAKDEESFNKRVLQRNSTFSMGKNYKKYILSKTNGKGKIRKFILFPRLLLAQIYIKIKTSSSKSNNLVDQKFLNKIEENE